MATKVQKPVKPNMKDDIQNGDSDKKSSVGITDVSDTKSNISETPSQIERKKKQSENSKIDIIKIDEAKNKGIILAPHKMMTLLREKCIDGCNFEVLRRMKQARTNTDKDGKPDPIKFEKLTSISRTLQQAESEYEQTLKKSYEKKMISDMSEEQRKKYYEEYKAAQEVWHQTMKNDRKIDSHHKTEFDVEKFNRKYDSKFYDGFAAFLESDEGDKFAIGKQYPSRKNPVRPGVDNADSKSAAPESKVYDEWSRAKALIKRRMVRTSESAGIILAAFLDYLIEDIIAGCINCTFDGNDTLKLTLARVVDSVHAPKSADIFKYVATLDNYSNVVKYVEDEKTYQLRRDAQAPSYERPSSYPSEFTSQVGNLFKITITSLAGKIVTKRENYISRARASDIFKNFLSHVVYETILRIGNLLHKQLQSRELRTITPELIWVSLETLFISCGIKFDAAETAIKTKTAKFLDHRHVSRVNRANSTVSRHNSAKEQTHRGQVA
jgi:hypothetical protein